VLTTGCRSSSEPPSESSTPRSAPHEDYPTARKRFRTHLVRRQPPPDTAAPIHAPADAREVAFESDGLQLIAWMSRDAVDATSALHPAVLYLHGGFGFDLSDWAATEPFRAAGFIVMAPILRGENGQPGVFSAFYDEVTDVLAAADTLARQPGVDPAHLYVAGHSVGGTLTMLAALSSTRFRAAASFSGAPDQRDWMAPRLEIAPYDPWDDEEFRIRSPLAFARSFKCPVRLYWGDREPFFTEATREIARRAKTAGLDFDAVQVEGDHSSMFGPASELAIAFFRQHR
jgi:dipeptidyl aminopeptidase/acylaminoacyl peptidase